MAFTGVVARNGRGSIIDGISTKVQCESVLQGEALALREGVCLASQRKMAHVSFESDSQALIKAVNSFPVGCPWEIFPLCKDISSLASEFQSCSFSFVPREANKVAHWIAKAVQHGRIGVHWVSNIPSTLADICAADLSPSGIG